MKTHNKNVDDNRFGNVLSELLACTKEMVPRKTLSAILAVTESAISQWVSGKTFPDSVKLRSLIAIYENQKLNEVQKDKLLKLKALLEYPLEEVWGKAPEDYKEVYLSDYALKECRYELDNSIAILYYDLKLELHNQFLKQIEVIKEQLVEKLLDTDDRRENTLDKKVKKMESYQRLLQDASTHFYLSSFTDTIKDINKLLILVLKEKLTKSDVNENKNKDIRANKNPYLLPIKAYLADQCKSHYDLQFLGQYYNRYFTIMRHNDNLYDIAFLDPSGQDWLMNIKVGKGNCEHINPRTACAGSVCYFLHSYWNTQKDDLLRPKLFRYKQHGWEVPDYLLGPKEYPHFMCFEYPQIESGTSLNLPTTLENRRTVLKVDEYSVTIVVLDRYERSFLSLNFEAFMIIMYGEVTISGCEAGGIHNTQKLSGLIDKYDSSVLSLMSFKSNDEVHIENHHEPSVALLVNKLR